MVTPQQNPLIVLNIDSATSQELPETHIEPIDNLLATKLENYTLFQVASLQDF